MKKAVLLVGFGGPASSVEVRPFLESVLEGIRIPPARFDAVLHHYELVGGVSPYNTLTMRQAAQLEAWLAAHGHAIPVRVGFRHSTPSLKDAFSGLAASGVTEVTGFVLSALRSYSSFEKYLERAEKGRLEAGAAGVHVRYTESFYNDPLFIGALADHAAEAIAALPGKRPYVLFTAHSIPRSMSDQSGYELQFAEVSSLVAARLGGVPWGIAYQSRSGRPEDPWLSPDVCEAIKSLDATRFDVVVLVPASFLCQNVEIMVDLDIEARTAAEARGLVYARAQTVFGHPSFLELMGRYVLKVVESA